MPTQAAAPSPAQEVVSPPPAYDSLFRANADFVADGFDFPVGKPQAKGYYNAQPFGGARFHLGDDWNGVRGGNTDLGDSVFAVAHGWVASAEDAGEGWGNVVRIVHQLPNGKRVESLYAHLNEMAVQPHTWIRRGAQVGTIGTANGAYLAHLHLETRHTPDLPLGGGYSMDTTGYVNPTAFIKAHRPSH